MNDMIETQHEGSTTYFVTGATGLMGSEFVYEVLKRSPDTQCIFLIRAATEAKKAVYENYFSIQWLKS
jgi:thioester reductase-like protein